LQRTDILICLLPLTPQTENILDAAAFAAMPRGAYFINVARGEHVVDEALLAALDSGHLAGTTIDPFREEPLPQSDPYWTHPKVTVTPHNSCQGLAKYGAPDIVENIRRARDGRPLLHVADRTFGY
jgi:glyoxylate/hydroxypyruvate reductase A